MSLSGAKCHPSIKSSSIHPVVNSTPIQDALEGFTAAEGMTPLLCAVFAEDVEMVRVLVRTE